MSTITASKKSERAATKNPAAPDNRISDVRYIRRTQVCTILGISPRTFWTYVKQDHFPRPHRFGRQLLMWRQDEILAWAEDNRLSA